MNLDVIYNQDCLEGMKSIPDESIDLIVTDPPYRTTRFGCSGFFTGYWTNEETKKGKIFYGCSNYPKCKEAFWDKPTGDACPECGAMLVIKNNNICCSSCDYEK